MAKTTVRAADHPTRFILCDPKSHLHPTKNMCLSLGRGEPSTGGHLMVADAHPGLPSIHPLYCGQLILHKYM